MATASPVAPFPAWRPDLTDLGTDSSVTISGVLPRGDGYGPFKDFVGFTQALPANCRGFFFARRSDGSIAVFAGTSTRLYLLDNTTFQWTDVSKGGAAYGDLVASDNWRFAQFNELVIAVQINTVPQKYTLNVGGAFADLGGSPPQASHIAIVNRIVMLTGLLANPRRVHWSDLDAPETWTAGIGLSDFQDLPDGGICHAVSGGDAYGVVFQDEAIRTLTFAPGSPAVFQIVRISTQDTLDYQYSVINVGTRTFFHSAQGFKVILAGGEPQSIGKEYVDAFFAGDVDTSAGRLVIGAADPQGTRVFWAYKSQSGETDLFDKILCFDWSIKDRPWSLIPMSGQYLGYLAKPGLTLEALDFIAPGGLTVLGAAATVGGAFGAGKVRLTLDAVSNAFFAIAGQNFIVVQGIVGTIEANGTWLSSQISIVDATHLDINVAFANAWISGGRIGGSLDALPFSLDSISTAAIAALAACGPTALLGFFTGSNIEAILETPEADIQGQLEFVSGLSPMTDSPDALCSLGYRMTPSEAISYTAETAVTPNGTCPQLLEARFQKGRLRIPAGSTWRYARGLRPEAQEAGEL
jgi:hypothetical protein